MARGLEREGIGLGDQELDFLHIHSPYLQGDNGMGKYSFVSTCSLDYLFALNCTMNAAKFYGTNADFNIAYDESITEDIRNKYNDAFPFKVIWHPLDALLGDTGISFSQVMTKYWIAQWILASFIVDKYDSICILQADEFLVNNVNPYFKIAAHLDMVVASEWTCSSQEFEDMKFGEPQSPEDVGDVILFDQLVFVGKSNRQVLIDTWKQQVAPFGAEVKQVHHPMPSLCRACKKNLNKDKVLGLDAHAWCWDRDDFDYKIFWTGDRFMNERKIRVNGVHTKVWKEGQDQTALDRMRGDPKFETGIHNFTTIKDTMIHFNKMTPSVEVDQYCKERFH